MMKKIIKISCIVLGVILLLAVALIAFLSITEYFPEDKEPAARIQTDPSLSKISIGDTVTVYTWNIGYGGLGKDSDFFMDGGEMVDPQISKRLSKTSPLSVPLCSSATPMPGCCRR